MKFLRNRIFLFVLIVMLFVSASPVASAHAASNGQQLSVYACKASRVLIQGYNQYGQFVTYTLNKSSSTCGWYNISNWWWKGYVFLTPYYPVSSEYQYYAGAMVWAYVPTYQSSSSWYSVNVAAPSTRQWILWRAQTWVNDHVSYSQSAYRDGYRKDCSGYVSFAWTGPTPGFATGTWSTNSYKISFDSLQPGDALNSTNGAHMILFKEWVNQSSGIFNAYEENPSYNGAHILSNVTLNKSTGRISVPGYTYPGNYFAIRRNGL